MADDGMLMNFALDDGPVLPKQSFQGGRWKDRLAAKKVAQHRVTKAGGPAPSKSSRDIFKGGNSGAQEEYIGSSRGPKRQRTDAEFRSEGNANRTAIGPRNTYPAASERPQSNNRNGRTREDDASRPAVISGKLPPGSISLGGGAGKKMKFGDDATSTAPTPAPRAVNNGRTAQDDSSRPAIISGKLPLGSINIGGGSGKKMTFGDESEAAVPRPVVKTAPGVGGVALNRDGTKGVISSLFTFNPSSKTTFEEPEEEAEPAKPTNAPLTEEMETFTNLGLSRRLAAHLSNKLDMKAPTAIQKASIPQMVSDDSDAFIQAQTGSGKTLAYLLPIVQRIIAMSVTDDSTAKNVQVHRNSGLFAIVLAPTRELCKQIAVVLEKLLRCAPWIVGTTVMGGESKQSEKARLRKGVNILIATPGRLADHLDNTEVLNVSTVRWLILDEGDRLMELGFEEEIKGIVEKIGRRSLAVDNKYLAQALPSRRITVLCSATMKMNVQRLGEISLKDAVHIMADPADEDASKNDNMDEDDKKFSAPAQLKQAYAIVPAKLRLVTLTAILKRAFARRGSVMKVIVFISCADSVDFHFSLFSRPGAISAEEAEKPSLPTSELTKETIAHGTAISSNTNPVILHKLHGSLAQNIRTATLKAFTDSSDPGVLICTDVASRGLDLPNVDYVIEYDPPFSADDHLHRVGRTARAGRDGRALIFLLPGDEEEYVSILASHYRDGKKSLVHNTAEELIRKGFGGTGREWEERATEFQLDVERWTIESPKYLEMARRGFQSHIRAYATHVADERKYFNMQTLHLGHLAKAFALRDKPGSIKVPGLRPKAMTKADRSVAARKAKRGETEKEEDKVPEGEHARKQKKLELDMPTVDENEAAKRMKRKIREHMASASEFNIG